LKYTGEGAPRVVEEKGIEKKLLSYKNGRQWEGE
jgi:hypothetical protein